jgi:hypothetical protein
LHRTGDLLELAKSSRADRGNGPPLQSAETVQVEHRLTALKLTCSASIPRHFGPFAGDID